MSAVLDVPRGTPTAILGQYELDHQGVRVLVGYLSESGEVEEVLDKSVNGRGRPYVVVRGFESLAELAGIVVDYRRQAERLDEIPMSSQAVNQLVEFSKEPS